MFVIEHEARFRHGRGRGRGRSFWAGGGEAPPADDAAAWFRGRLPEEWFGDSVAVDVDREEIVVTGTLAGGGDDPATGAGRIARFREETREQRMQIAREAQERYSRVVSWGAAAGEVSQLFTTASVPVMTRLRQPERRVLDTLVEAGVARSRSEALAWCVKLVGQHEEDWIARLRDALGAVEEARAEGPDV